MTLDPDAERVLEMVRQSGRPPYDQVTPADEHGLCFVPPATCLPSIGAGGRDPRPQTAPGLDGNTVPLRLYRAA